MEQQIPSESTRYLDVTVIEDVRRFQNSLETKSKQAITYYQPCVTVLLSFLEKFPLLVVDAYRYSFPDTLTSFKFVRNLDTSQGSVSFLLIRDGHDLDDVKLLLTKFIAYHPSEVGSNAASLPLQLNIIFPEKTLSDTNDTDSESFSSMSSLRRVFLVQTAHCCTAFYETHTNYYSVFC